MNEMNKCLLSIIEETENPHVLAATEDKAILSAMGAVISDSESDSDTDSVSFATDYFGCLQLVLESTSYNWFEVEQYVEKQV